MAQSIAETHTLRHATAHIPSLLHAFLSSLPLEQSQCPWQTGQWLACWACGALFALHTHSQPPRCPLCSIQGGLSLLRPPPPPCNHARGSASCPSARAPPSRCLASTAPEDFENHLLSLDIGYGLYQETWSDRSVRHSIPSRYGYVISRTQGAGIGFLILWAWALVKGPSTPHVAMDCTD